MSDKKSDSIKAGDKKVRPAFRYHWQESTKAPFGNLSRVEVGLGRITKAYKGL